MTVLQRTLLIGLSFIFSLSLPSHASDSEELIQAAGRGDVSIVRQLLNKGADINAKDDNGWTALMMASSYKGNYEIVRMLLAKGADVNAGNNERGTALYNACVFGHSEIVNELIAHGADVDARNDRGFTPLIVASGEGYIDIVKALLAKGADIQARTNRGTTALYRAKQAGHNEIVRLLQGAGAKETPEREASISKSQVTPQPERQSMEHVKPDKVSEARPSFEGISAGMPVQLILLDKTSVEGNFVRADIRTVTTMKGTYRMVTPRDRIHRLSFPSLDGMHVRNTMRDIMETVFFDPTPALVRLRDGRKFKGLILPDRSALFRKLDEGSTIKINSNGKIVIVSRGEVDSVDFLE
jgi:hypothetical protein